MISRVEGVLESVDDAGVAVLGLPGGVAIEVRLTANAAATQRERVGQRVTLHTLLRLEGEAQGASMAPTLIGFSSEQERRFFRLFTRVKGVGARKAMRALSAPVETIAGAISRRDARALSGLPEIGKRLAETVIAELSGKVDGFLTDEPRPASEAEGKGVFDGSGLGEGAQRALEAMLRLGETREAAESRVRAALRADATLEDAEAILAAAYGGSG